MNIAHLDIKHQNILIDENLNIKLTDFSVSNEYYHQNDGRPINFPVVGTSVFMAPEILTQQGIRL